MLTKKKIVLLGATGSIGDSTLRILEKHADKLELIAVAADSNTDKLAQIIKKFNVPHACVFNNDAYQKLKAQTALDCQLHAGLEGLKTLASLPEADLIVIAVVGAIGIHPTLAAIRAGKTIAIANKEPLVMAGEFIMQEAKKHNTLILPVDSEHNSIFQCIESINPTHIDQVILTASGGMFRDFTQEQLRNVTTQQAIQHPNWNMGAKVTVDSSTLVNKGLEIIEARWLFNLQPKQLHAVIHRQSIIHSLITLVDGCILSQLNPPSMTFAIQHCLLYPERAQGVDTTLDFKTLTTLSLEPIDLARYPGFKLAKQCLEVGGSAPAIYNAANEIAVKAFLNERIPYLKITDLIAATLNQLPAVQPKSLDDILALDQEARQIAQELL